MSVRPRDLFGGWLPLLRIARRDALRARGRSALIVAMIALPILALTTVDVLARSAQLEPDEEVARTLGSTQALIEAGWGGGGALLQAPDPGRGNTQVGDGTEGQERPDARSLVPVGYRVLTSQDAGVQARTEAGIASATWTEALVGDPEFVGRFRVRDGTAPTAAGEVAVTSDLFDRLGVELGGTVRLAEPEHELTLTGVVDQVGAPGMSSFFARPGELIGPAGLDADLALVYLAGKRPVTWTDVQALNEKGVTVYSRAVLLDPPPDSAVPYYTENDGSTSGAAELVLVILALAVVVVLSGLEVCLLAGAAFAVGARRQARTLGLVAAAGGSRSQVRRVVLAGGVVLGASAAVVGVTLGLMLAALGRPVLTDLADADFGRFDVRPLELLAIAALGLVTGVLAAVLPARTAARQDPVVALTGRRGQVRTARKVPVIGMVLVVLGVGAAALGSVLAVALTTGLNPGNGGMTALVAGLIAGGAALAQIGLIVTSPAIIGMAGRWSRRLPLAGRLALRDAARHRGRSAPAMAAVLTAVTGSTALLLYITALDAHDREEYQPSWPTMSAGVALDKSTYHPATGEQTVTALDPGTIRAALAGKLPPFDAQVVTTTDETCADADCSPAWAEAVPPPQNVCPIWQDREPTAAEQEKYADDWRCAGAGLAMSGSFGGVPVGGGEVLDLVTGGKATSAATAALDSGGVVVFSRGLVRDDGTVTFRTISGAEARSASAEGREPTVRTVSVHGYYLKVARVTGGPAVYSPGTAKALGLTVKPSTMLLRFDQLPSTDQEEAAQKALQGAGLDTYLSVERGYTSDYGLGLLALMAGAGIITLGAAGIATGLAQADARADHATLAAIGAAPRLRRTLAAAQALSIAGLGTALGIAAGFVPAVALIGAVESLDLVVPWLRLLAVLVGIPLLAGVLAWLLTRSRVPLERRVA